MRTIALLALLAGGVSAAWKTLDPNKCSTLQAESSLLTEQDCTSSLDARKKADDLCASTGDSEVDREAGRDILAAAVGDDPIRNNLESAKSNKEFEDGLMPAINESAMTTGLPVIVGIIVVVIWFFCCWNMCCCCTCCRCCAKDRGPLGKIGKLVVALVFAGLALGCIISASLGQAGSANITAGLDRFVCKSAEMADVTLSGNKEQKFMGMLMAVDAIRDMVANLKPDGEFFSEIREVLLSTTGIEKGMQMLVGTLTLLEKTMGLPVNVKPVSNADTETFHKCVLCETVSETIKPINTELADGFASALADARAEVETSLTGEASEDLAKSLNETVKPLNDLKNQVLLEVAALLADDRLEIIDLIKMAVSNLVLLLVILVFPLVFCGCCSVGCLIMKPMAKEPAPGVNPYNTASRNFACCGCCFGTLYIFIAFLFGAILNTMAAPLGSICLIMDDLSGDNLKKWGPALGMEGGDETLFGIVDECLTDAGEGRIFDMVKTDACPKPEGVATRPTDCQDSEKVKVSMREKLMGDLKGSIDESFSAITEKDGPAVEKTSETDGMKTMFAVLKTPASGLTLLETDASGLPTIADDAKYSALNTDPDVAEKAWGTSASCTTVTYDPAAFGDISDVTAKITSIEDFKSLLYVGGAASVAQGAPDNCDSTGPGTVTCSGGATQPICDAAKNLLSLKNDILNSNKYRCDLLDSTPNQAGGKCDPKDMRQMAGNGAWVDDCTFMAADGIAVAETVILQDECGYTEFVEYLQDFELRIKQSADRLDWEAENAQTSIVDGMKGLVDKHILEKITDLLDGINCSFMNTAYRGVIDGLCFQTVVGLSQVGHALVALGSLSIILVIFYYLLFRRTADNRMVWNKNARSVVAA